MASTIAGTADEARDMREKLLECAMQFADAGDEKADVAELSALAQLVRNRDADAAAAIAAGGTNAVTRVYVSNAAMEGAAPIFDAASKSWSIEHAGSGYVHPHMIRTASNAIKSGGRVFDGGDSIIVTSMMHDALLLNKKTGKTTVMHGSPSGGMCCSDGKCVYIAGYAGGNGDMIRKWDGERWESFVRVPFHAEQSAIAYAGGYIYFIGNRVSFRVCTVSKKVEWLPHVRSDMGNVRRVVTLDQIRLLIFDCTYACSVLNTVTWDEERIVLPRSMPTCHIVLAE